MLKLDEPSDRFALVCGIDEVGRGPLAGPVIAAAVVLEPNRPIEGIADSKKLSHKRRIELADCVKQDARAWALGRAEVDEIDQLNILQATMLAMRRAYQELAVEVDFAYIDGNSDPRLGCNSATVVKGDDKFECIGAASIVAKVARDSEMESMAKRFPEYGFERNKGYPTPFHLNALQRHGPCTIHRRTFHPVTVALNQHLSALHNSEASL